jgi:hypothetical protein
MRLLIKVFAPLLTAVLIGLVAWPLLHPRTAAVHRLVLKRELAALRTPPGAKLLDSKLSMHDAAATVSSDYRSAWSAERLEEFYLAELRANGWEALPGDGSGTAVACKGPYEALWRAQDAAAGGATDYAIAMSWGARQRCAEAKSRN